MNAAQGEIQVAEATVKPDYDFARKYEAAPLICPA
jgi:hypothetical protein